MKIMAQQGTAHAHLKIQIIERDMGYSPKHSITKAVRMFEARLPIKVAKEFRVAYSSFYSG